MKTLSAAERSHLEALIRKEADAEIAGIVASRVDWENEVTEIAVKLAIGKLGIDKLLAERMECEKGCEEADKRLAAVNEKMAAKMPKRKQKYGNGCAVPMDQCEAVSELAEKFRDVAMARHAVGAKVQKVYGKLRKKILLLEKCKTREEVDTRDVLDW